MPTNELPTNELPTNELPTNEMPKSGYVPVVSPTIPNTNPNNISYLSDLEFQIIMGLIRSNINNFDNKYDPSPRAEISVGNQKEY